LAGNRHMEYLHQRGSFDDLPLDAILADFRVHYPRWVSGSDSPGVSDSAADFLADVDAETDKGAA
jgi:hypothetical protein